MADLAIDGLFDEPVEQPIGGLFDDQNTTQSAPQPTLSLTAETQSTDNTPIDLPDLGSPNGQPDEQLPPDLQPGIGGFEAALHLISGLPAAVVGTAAGAWETLMTGDAKAFDPAREAAATGGVLEAITYEPRTEGGKAYVEHIGRAFQGYVEGVNALAETEGELFGGTGAEIKLAGELAPFLLGGPKGKGKVKVEPKAEPIVEAPAKAAPLEGEVIPKPAPAEKPIPEPPPDLVAEWEAFQQPEAPRASEATRDGVLPDDSKLPTDEGPMAAAREDAGIPPVGKTEPAAPTMVLDLRNGSHAEHVAASVERANDNLVNAVAEEVAARPPDIKIKTAATAGKARKEAGEGTPSIATVLSSPSHLAEKAKFRKLKPYVKGASEALRADRRYSARFNEKIRDVELALSPGKERLLDFGKGLRARRQQMNDLLIEQSLDPDVKFTREGMVERGIEPKVINGFFKMQKMYAVGLRATNILRKKEGLEPIAGKKNYVRHMFGQYLVVGREGAAQPRILKSTDSLREAVAAAKEAQTPGLEVGVQIKTPQFDGLNMSAQVLDDKNFFALRNNIQKDLHLTAEEATELLKGVTRPRAKGRSPSFLRERKGREGWMKDMDHVHRVYFKNLSRHLALDPFKRMATKRFQQDFGSMDKPEPGIGTYVKKYIDDVNGTPHAADEVANKALIESALGPFLERHLGPAPFSEIMRGTGLAVSTLKLGLFNVGSAVVNATQFLGAQAILGPTYFTNGFARAMRQMANGGVRHLTHRELSSGARRDRRLLHQMGIEYGADNIAQLSEGMSHAGKGMRAVGDGLQASMVLFTGMEHALRATTALGAYYKAKSKGIPHRAALDYGAHINDRVNFDYSTADAGSAFRSGAVMNEVLRFKKFPVKYIEFMRGLKGAENAKFWVPFVAVSGVWGLPGTEALGSLVEFATGWNPITEGKHAIDEGDVPEWASNVSNYGLPALVGIDTSRRTGVGDAIPNELKELVPVMAASAYKGLGEVANANWSEALKQITPSPVNIWEAVHNEEMFTPWERMFAAAGFRSLDKSKTYDQGTHKRMQDAGKSELRDDYGRTVKSGSPEKQAAAYLEARRAGVTIRSLRNEAKQNR